MVSKQNFVEAKREIFQVTQILDGYKDPPGRRVQLGRRDLKEAAQTNNERWDYPPKAGIKESLVDGNLPRNAAGSPFFRSRRSENDMRRKTVSPSPFRQVIVDDR